MKYNEFISKLRSVARDILRMELVNKVRDELLAAVTQYNSERKNLEWEVENAQQNIAREQFGLTQVQDADPDKETKEKNLNEAIANLEKFIEARQKELAELAEDQTKTEAEYAEKIENIENSSVKVNRAHLTEKTQMLIDTAAKGTVQEMVVEDMATAFEPEDQE